MCVDWVQPSPFILILRIVILLSYDSQCFFIDRASVEQIVLVGIW